MQTSRNSTQEATPGEEGKLDSDWLADNNKVRLKEVTEHSREREQESNSNKPTMNFSRFGQMIVSKKIVLILIGILNTYFMFLCLNYVNLNKF